MSRRICDMPPFERGLYLNAIVQDLNGKDAVVAFDAMRRHDEARTLQGRLIGIATPVTGGTADVLIVRSSFGDDLYSISSATIVDITEV